MRRLTLFALVLCCFTCIAQQNDSLRLEGEALISRQVEHLAALEESGLDISELTSTLEGYLMQPLNLNQAEKKDLESLQFLDEVQIKNFLDYRKKYGEFHSIYELKIIEGFGRNTIEKIMPFVSLSRAPEDQSVSRLFGGRHEAILRFQRKLVEQAGYQHSEKAYAGDPARLYFRYRYRVPGRLSLGLIAEKDPGEPYFIKGAGPDFISVHASYEGKGVIRTLMAGDYHARFGQGLVLWTGFAFSGGSDPSSIKRHAAGISPNTSSNENSFLRGFAATTAYRNLRLTILISSSKLDANIDYGDSLQPEPFVSSFPGSGYHRTEGEIADRNSLEAQHIGGNIKFLGNRCMLGATAVYSVYGLNIHAGTQTDDIYRFNGKKNLVWGVDYSILLRRTNIFGEMAMSNNMGWAILFGISHTTDNGSIFCLQAREYRKNFQNLLAQANGRRDHNSNERGIRLMTEFPLLNQWTMSASWDHYHFPWLTHGNISPVKGQDFRAGILFRGYMSGNYSATYRYHTYTKSSGYRKGWTDKQNIQIKHDVKLKARLQLSQTFSTLIQLGYVLSRRLEEGFRSAGACLSGDIHYHPSDIPLKIVGRYALFNTDDYEGRLYFYENDVLYASSMPAYYGKGSRCFILFKYTPFDWLDTWLRFSLTTYTDRNTISSGNDEIQGNKLPELKTQIRIKL
jgi:hypothetical protein